MNIWKTLDMESSNDKRTIKKAYARRLKALDPESEPEAFQKLREAYEEALYRAEQGGKLNWSIEYTVSPSNISPSPNEKSQEEKQKNHPVDWKEIQVNQEYVSEEIVEKLDVKDYINAIGQSLQNNEQADAIETFDKALKEVFTIDDRFELEEGLLLIIHHFEYQPLEFIFHVVAKLAWKQNMSPFREYNHTRIYNYIQLLVARAEFLDVFRDKFKKYRDEDWLKAEKILFSNLSEAELESQYVSSTQENTINIILEYIDIRNPHPEINPVSRLTYQWWERKWAESARKRSKNSGSSASWWGIGITIFIFIKIVLFMMSSDN